MGALFVIIFLAVAIIRHIGACVIEAQDNASAKQIAIEGGSPFYSGYRGQERLVSNNHLCISGRDQVLGRWVEDIEDHIIYYYDVIAGIAEMRKARNNLDPNAKEKTVFKYKPKFGDTVYIDYETEKIYYLAHYEAYTKDYNDLRTGVWFYTDFPTRTKVIRKSDRQIAYEEQLEAEGKDEKFYDFDKISLESADIHEKTSDWVYDGKRKHLGKVWRVYGQGEEIVKSVSWKRTGNGAISTSINKEYL